MPLTKKTKVVATIGPNSQNVDTLTRMGEAGMNVARLNFSHGDHAKHQANLEAVREAEANTGRPIAVLQDLSGPKIRIGEFYKERLNLKKGSEFTLTTKKITGDESRVFVNYKKLPQELQKGDVVMLDDGKKKLTVTDTTDTDVVTRVEIGGETKGERGVNLPGAALSVDALTSKDKKDLEFGIANDVDFVALSFVRSPKDIEKLRRILDKRGSHAKIIAKIETAQAVEQIDAIIEATDGIMVARGDLAIEVPAERVPELQKDIVRKCNNAGKPVITATQMLESMIHDPQPTRAEISDVANAIFDGSDAIMLSEETTLGEHPVEVVETMAKIAKEVEHTHKERYSINDRAQKSITDAVTTSVVHTAHDIDATLIVAVTQTGFTARMMSRYKPLPLIMSMTAQDKTWRQLQLTFGAYPIKVDELASVDATMELVREEARAKKLAKKGDHAVVAAGVPFTKDHPETNMMVVEEV